VPTAAGDLWFKAPAPDGAFEAGLTAFLARLRPGLVPELVAFDAERGWMLMRDHGTRLRSLIASTDDLHHWDALLPQYAELQIAAAAHAEELLALGVPDERLAGIEAHLRKLLDEPDFLLLGQPDALTEDEYQRMQAALPEVDALCRRLAGYGIAETVQHDDLNDGNVFVRDGSYVVVDWGDSCISHPFHTMVVTLRSVAYRLDVDPGAPVLERLRDAYLEPFGRPEELRPAFELAYRIGTLARALAWYEGVAARPPELRAPDVEAVAYGLQRFLENGPIGSWRWD
jgi:Phosphotransferase enzyme family